MKKKEIEILIIAKDILDPVVKYVDELSHSHDIKIVTTKNNCQAFSKNYIIDENLFLRKGEFISKLKAMGIPRPNWYYQQFLKYYLVSMSKADGVHIIDGDSVLNKDVVGIERYFYNNKRSYQPYQTFTEFFFPVNKLNNCFVTNQMYFDKKVFSEMLDFLGNDWAERLLLNISDEKKFSEYQFYIEYLLLNYSVETYPIKVFRRFDLVNDSIQNGLKKYDLLAWEPEHKTGFLRKIRAKIYYFLSFTIS